MGKKSAKEAQRMELHLLEKKASFSAEGHTKDVFFESAKIEAKVMGLEAGKKFRPAVMSFFSMPS